MHDFTFLKPLDDNIDNLDELIERFEQSNDVYSDSFNAVLLDRLITAKELVIKTRDALLEKALVD